MRMLVAAAEAQTHYCRVIKLCFLSSCFEYQDLFVGQQNRLSERELLIAEGDE
jgi:hypothetical protein